MISLYEYDKQFFTYGILTGKMWRMLIHNAMKQFKVQFDLENNESIRKQRIIIIPQNKWPTSECKFKCESFAAGGDWEDMVLYFRCQIVSGYAIGMNQYLNPHFVFIPNKEQGNIHLIPCDKKDCERAPHGTEENPDLLKYNEKECWDSLKIYLTDLVNLEINNVNNK